MSKGNGTSSKNERKREIFQKTRGRVPPLLENRTADTPCFFVPIRIISGYTLHKQGERTVDFLKNILEPPKLLEPTRKSKGGIRDISELTAESVERVCGEFYDPWFDPKVTITYKTMTFNTSCVKYFPTTQYFLLLWDVESLRLIAKPTTESEDERCLKVAYFRNGKNVPRKCTKMILCQELFECMGWDQNVTYRVPADFRRFDKRDYLVFNLDEAEPN